MTTDTKDNLLDTPFCIALNIGHVVTDVTFTPATDTYNGVVSKLANKTLKVSHVVYDSGPAAGNILQYIKLDGELIEVQPKQTIVGPPVERSWTTNVQEKFGKPYLAVRSVITVKKSATNDALGYLYIYGKYTDTMTE